MTGILLINLGTPDTAQTSDVKKYLREFLMDPLVIDINPVFRWLLVNLMIAPFRSPKSARAYESIWNANGSPLLHHSLTLTSRVGAALEDNFVVTLGMRYGRPSIPEALDLLLNEKIDKIRVLPLYPQYALSSTQSSIDCVSRHLKKIKSNIPVEFCPDFFGHPIFIRAFVEVAKPYILSFNPDHILMSFHGLPEHHLTKIKSLKKHCLVKEGCCDSVTSANQKCYRAQSFMTARLIAYGLGLEASQYSVTFQSRLGRKPWIKPYTDHAIIDLAKSGKKKVLVICPSFVADCLETLEEIQIRGRESFIKSGGEDLQLVPSLNSHPRWVEAVCDMLKTF